MTILSVRHVTTYRYSRPVAFGEHRMMFRPRDSYDQRLIAAEVEITPEPAHFRWIHDVFGNCVAIASFAGQARELRFESRMRLDHAPARAPDFQIEEYALTYPFAYEADELPDLAAARSSGTIPTPSGSSSAGRASSCAKGARPRPESC